MVVWYISVAFGLVCVCLLLDGLLVWCLFCSCGAGCTWLSCRVCCVVSLMRLGE